MADFITIDDFEAYNDIDPPDPASNNIFGSWLDGYGTLTNGALTSEDYPPYAEQSMVHSGAQSMKYAYDTNLMICESTLTLADHKDWTTDGVTKLLIWYRSEPGNFPDRMFVALNGNAVVYHREPEATLKGRWTWTEWVIDLQEFTNQGVDLTNVNTLTIGIGTKDTPGAGGQGQMYFDDIRLYR